MPALRWAALLIFSARVLWDRWYLALTRRSDPLNGVAWALLVSLLYGIGEVIYGVLFLGYPLFTALADSGLQYMPRLPVSRDLGWYSPSGDYPKIYQIYGMVDGDLCPCLFSLS